jgi:hypothetical protein
VTTNVPDGLRTMSGDATPSAPAWTGQGDGADQWDRSELVAVAMFQFSAPLVVTSLVT